MTIDFEAMTGFLQSLVRTKSLPGLERQAVELIAAEMNRLGFESIETDEGLPEVDPALVHRAIKELPTKGRTVLIMRALEGYPHKEIAETLDISVSTSKTQYSRALSLLNLKLKGHVK